MDLFQEFNIHGERKGERLLSLIQQSIIADVVELVVDEDVRMNRLRVGLLGYEVSEEKEGMD